MHIVADENIPLVDELYESIGEITRLPGRDITPQSLQQADALLVRSITLVNEALLAGTPVKFVGTTTIGVDHIDLAYLEQARIGFVNAPGSNANSVVEYVLSALSVLSEQQGFDWTDKTVGIIGKGNVGKRLYKRLQKLGIKALACDPWLDEDDLVDLTTAMACDIVTLHTPLVTEGEHPTHHLIDTEALAQLGGHQVLINTSRGAVVDNRALSERLRQANAPTVVLDVWEGEPGIDLDLLEQVNLATPHIAGYSLDGKMDGADMVYQGFCRFFGLPTRKKVGQFKPEPPLTKMAFSSAADPYWAVHTAIRTCYDIRHDDANLRLAMARASDPGPAFDALRKHYRDRREFNQIKMQLKQADSSLHSMFKALGFKLK